MKIKACLDCAEEKPLEEFPRNKSRPDGHGAYCSPCYAIRSRRSYEKRRAAAGRYVRPRREVPDGQKYCPACGETQVIDRFPLNRAGRGGRGTYCKPCHNAKGKATYVRLFGSTREYHLRRRYGITVEQYDALVAEQGGVCALCLERPPQHVDHDHLTGAVRGALCSCCNQGLGNFRDSAANLRAAASYLEASTIQRVRVADGVYRLAFPAQPTGQVPVADLAPLLAGRRRA